MLILISCFFYFMTALVLVVLRVVQPNARYGWLVASGGAVIGLFSVLTWLAQTPLELTLPIWQPAELFDTPVHFIADGISTPLGIAIAALTLSVLLTGVTQPLFVNSLAWTGTLVLGGIGILAVTANNPLTILLAWALLDLTELVVQLSSVRGALQNEKVVIAFSTRAVGIGILIWVNILSIAGGNSFEFQSLPTGSGIFLIFAAGLRLGVYPLHLPYSAESSLRRGFGTSLRLVSAASSLILLGRIPAGGLDSVFTPFLILFALAAALYGGWMWLRTPDELNGRPYWVISLASLSILSALNGNPLGAISWSTALILIGGMLFLSSVPTSWLNRLLLIGAWSLSSLPFSLTASAWLGTPGLFTPFAIIAQGLVIAGFVRHALRPSGRDSLAAQPLWTLTVHPAGILILIVFQIGLGFFGWDGALQIGAWLQALLAAALTVGLVWAARRFRIFNPFRAYWVTEAGTRLNGAYQGLWGIYRSLARMSQTVTLALEGEGGIMWTLLFLVIFIMILMQGIS